MEFLPLHYSPESLWMQGMNKLNQYKGEPKLEKLAKITARVMALALPSIASVGVIYHLVGGLGKAAFAMTSKETLQQFYLEGFKEGADFKAISWQAAAFTATKIVTCGLAVVGVFSPEKALALAEKTGLYKTGMNPEAVDKEIKEMQDAILNKARESALKTFA